MTHRSAAALFLVQFALSASALGQAWEETCDDIQAMAASGWVFINHSSPLGTTGWYQGNPEAFPPRLGAGYIASDFLCGSGLSTQSNWVLSPVRTFYNGDRLSLQTRTLIGPAMYPDRLQIRLSTAGASTNIGSSAADVGDFTRLLWDINPNYTPTGYPWDWEIRQTSNITGLPVGGAQGRIALRYFVENGGPDGTRGTLIGVDHIQLYSQGPLGACCLVDGSCTLVTQSSCTNAGGIYQGGNTACGTGCPPPAFVEQGDSPDLPLTATVIRGVTGTPLPSLGGHLDSGIGDRADMFRISICDRLAFSARATNAVLYLFDLAGVGVVRSQASGGSQVIFSGSVPSDGDYYLACSFSPSSPVDTYFVPIWGSLSSIPSGPGAHYPVGNWVGGPPVDKHYGVSFTGVCYVGDSCAANCDQSTSTPILSANDFACFMNQFAAGDTRANCDRSTTPPILNANDFVCFLNEFAHCL